MAETAADGVLTIDSRRPDALDVMTDGQVRPLRNIVTVVALRKEYQ